MKSEMVPEPWQVTDVHPYIKNTMLPLSPVCTGSPSTPPLRDLTLMMSARGKKEAFVIDFSSVFHR